MPALIQGPIAMHEHGKAFAQKISQGTVIALVGDMGAGKTHWAQGFVAGMGCDSKVSSPTFAIVNEYHGGRIPMFHFDFHRIQCSQELVALGWDDYLDRQGVLIIEWADKFPELLPTSAHWITIEPTSENTRILTEHNSPVP